jgi:lysophospholipase L1-like esterase
MRLLFLVDVAVVAATFAPVASINDHERVVAPGDPHLYFSEQNWDMQESGVALSVNPGAYLKLNFVNSSFVGLRLRPVATGSAAREGQGDAAVAGNSDVGVGSDSAGRPAPPPAFVDGQYMNLIYSIDNGEYVIVPVFNDSTEITLAENLGDSDLSKPHTLVLYIYNSLQINRWENPAHSGSALLVQGIALNASAATVAPTLRSKRALIFGDSITEGCAAQCKPDPSCHADKTKGDLCTNAATKTWGPTVAAALDAEFSQVGFGGLGWLVGGGGGVPPFYTPHNDTRSSWNKIWRGSPRNFSNLDYIFVLHGTNDGIGGQKGQQPSEVAASVQGWLSELRATAGPFTEVFLTVPFGGFGAANRPENALPDGFAAYQGNHSGGNDTRTHYIDLGREAAIGLECWKWGVHYVPAYGSRCGPSFAGCAGIHPRGGTVGSARHGELGAMVVARGTATLEVA